MVAKGGAGVDGLAFEAVATKGKAVGEDDLASVVRRGQGLRSGRDLGRGRV